MNNIYFKIGQPNTGKSNGFKISNLQKEEPFKSYVEGTEEEIGYTLIPVSGGVGNEYKGLQNTDLAISYDPIKTGIRFGEFLQSLMKAILQPSKPYVVFLDDFHNQDISSLLSEYTPLFKGQQKANLIGYESFIKNQALKLDLIDSEDFEIAEDFILQWNDFITALVKETKDQLTLVSIPITNRVSGSDLKLVFPANFYLLGAANFNEKTLSIFADWNDRAEIDIVDPIEVQEIAFKENDEGFMFKIDEQNPLDEEDVNFIKCCKTMNNELKNILSKENIYDYHKYCFGIWKVVDEKGLIVKDKTKVIKFFFSMIKNSLIYNNRNSYINTIGWNLIKAMKKDKWFTAYIIENELNVKFDNIDSLDIESDDENGLIFELLHKLNIYDN